MGSFIDLKNLPPSISTPVQIGSAAITGGLTAEIAGGDFWKGERGCLSHKKWLMAEVKRSFRPTALLDKRARSD